MGFADIALLEVIRGKLTYEHAKAFVPQVLPSGKAESKVVQLEKKAA